MFEQLQNEEVIETPGATEQEAEAAEEQPGASQPEKEAERIEEGEDEADEIVRSKLTPDLQKAFNKALGIKRAKDRERLQREREQIQREVDGRVAAMARTVSQPKPEEKKAPEAQPTEPEPQLPDFGKALMEWTKPFEEFGQWQTDQTKKWMADHAAWRNRATENTERLAILSEQIGEQNKRLSALPEIKEMQTVSRQANLRNDLLDYVGNVLAPIKNGHEVIREVLLDADLLEQLQEFDRVKDAAGIATFLHSVSVDLRRNAHRSAEEDEELPSPNRQLAAAPPKPITPVKKTAKVSKDLDDLSPEEYQATRLKQMAKQ